MLLEGRGMGLTVTHCLARLGLRLPFPWRAAAFPHQRGACCLRLPPACISKGMVKPAQPCSIARPVSHDWGLTSLHP